MKLSNYFIPTLKEDPVEAQIVSHKLMLRSGMVRQSSAGIYSWLPLGLKVLKNIENIVREEQNKAGCIEVLMPTLQPAELWEESGRYDDYGLEMLRMRDRHERPLLYGPTNEELITDIFRQYIKSYKDLPKHFYHIQWKFRDEIRPRFGVMRGREFLMKDNYSFDLDHASAVESYQLMYSTYLKTFERMGLRTIAVRADTGAIGGDMSHEFQILAETGESQIYYDEKIDHFDGSIEDLQNLYAAADEQHDPENCPIPQEQLKTARGIEVGHIFNFGTKYSAPMKACVTTKEGDMIPVHMGSYGIGVSRLVGAIIEACHDEKGIVWPKSVSPFDCGIINIKAKDEDCQRFCDDVYGKLQAAGKTVLYDDRPDSGGVKFARMDLIGLPWQFVVGPKSVQAGKVELKNRLTGERHDLTPDDLLQKMMKE